MTTAYDRHPLSALFSQFDIGGKEFESLVADIKANGLLNQITTHDGMILDGWNRYQACLKAKVRPIFTSLPPGLDPWKFVWAMNGQRRHMTAADLVSIYLKHEAMTRPEAPEVGGTISSPPSPSIKTIQTETGVSRGTAQLAAKIARAQDPELNEALAEKRVSLEQAAELAQLPEPERKAALENPAPKAPKAKEDPDECQSCKALREELDELISESRAQNEEFQAMIRVCDADDRLAQLRDELEKMAGQNRLLNERMAGKMSECHALAGDAKRWMNKFLKLEKKFKALDGDATFQKGA